ncbi:lytic murein transglycosylase [Desulfohalovibrio reitneri]|uniref:lytic murein transglycosylase n=1 Tax=Desulfohalovibrio reitneri TaxID=1307759 RepID=UPI0005594F69|nr:lytic murein transglycosylase [Desulfohalovibrio reitneri]
MRPAALLALAALLAALAAPAQPVRASDVGLWRPLVERLAEDGLNRDYLRDVFSRPQVRYQPRAMANKMVSLLKIKTTPRPEPKPQPKAEGGTEPSPPKPRGRVLQRYFTPTMLSSALRFMDDHAQALREAEQSWNVPPEILTSIMLVETRLGSYLGKGNAFLTLASMALSENFLLVQPYLPMNELTPTLKKWLVRRTRQKANWAYEELLAFIEYAKTGDLDPLSIPSSPYGAIGLCQFMPSNAQRFGVDANQDGRVDLFHPEDALHSIGNYLVYHGWKPGLSTEQQRDVLYHYNHSHSYTLTIVRLAEQLRSMQRAEAE